MDNKVAMKFDNEKPRLELIDAVALEGLAKVLTFGANKYAADNWRAGLTYRRVIGAALRHIAAIQRGEDLDPESGLPHIDHLGCCWMFLSNYINTGRTELDDRYKEPKKEYEQNVQRVREDLGTDRAVPGSWHPIDPRAVVYGARTDGGEWGICRESKEVDPRWQIGPAPGSKGTW